MKCHICQSENPEGKKFCAECGAEFPQPGQPREEQPVVAVSTGPGAMRPGWFVTVAAIIVAATVVGSVLSIYYSPDYSWSASIRDHDGDGVPDESDPSPYDSDIWTYGSATAILVICNDYNTSVEFSWVLYLNLSTEVRWSITVPPGEYRGTIKNMTWLVGETSSEWHVSVSGHIPGSYYGTTFRFDSHLVHDGQSYTFVAAYPDDFPAPPYA